MPAAIRIYQNQLTYEVDTGIIQFRKAPLFFGGSCFCFKIKMTVKGVYTWKKEQKQLLVGVNLNNDPEFETALKELESLAVGL